MLVAFQTQLLVASPEQEVEALIEKAKEVRRTNKFLINESNGGSVRTKPVYAKFANMLKMHIPMGAVCAKMARCGFSTAEVDAFKNDMAMDPVAPASLPPVPITTPMAVVPVIEMARAGNVTAVAVAEPVTTVQVFAPSLLQQITDLKKMKDEGVLTEEEFSAAKAKLLA